MVAGGRVSRHNFVRRESAVVRDVREIERKFPVVTNWHFERTWGADRWGRASSSGKRDGDRRGAVCEILRRPEKNGYAGKGRGDLNDSRELSCFQLAGGGENFI